VRSPISAGHRGLVGVALGVAMVLSLGPGAGNAGAQQTPAPASRGALPSTPSAGPTIDVLPGMPPVVDPSNLYSTTQGHVRSIPVGEEPHGLSVWPQPGRYSLGHTGNLR